MLIDKNVINHLQNLGIAQGIIHSFINNTPQTIQEIENAHLANNDEFLKHSVHKYKSSSRQLGLMQLSNLCLEVEKMTYTGMLDYSKVSHKILEIKEMASKAVQELADIQKELN